MISKKQNGTHRKNFADKQQDEYIQQLKTGIAIAINFMDERTKRLFAGSLYLGAHKILSIANIADICKCSDATVKRGQLLSLKEHEQEQKRQYNKINNIVKNKYSNKEDISRPKLVKVRHQVAGRKGHGNRYNGFLLHKIISDGECGDPTAKIGKKHCPVLTISSLTKALSEHFNRSFSWAWVKKTVDIWGYSMQKNKKMDQRGESHVDREHQFKTIDQVRFAALYALDVAQNDGHPLLEAPKEGWTIEQQRIIQGLDPVLSLDSMAKLPVGKFARAGQRLRPVGQPLHVNDHDFCDNKVTPYAIFDIGRNFGMIFLGHHDTAEFAVDNLERWWLNYGKRQYSEAKTIHLLMDCGGSNSYRCFVEGKNFKIEAHHYPPGTSKYNPIEHRMFPHCSRALQGQILLSEQCIQ